MEKLNKTMGKVVAQASLSVARTSANKLCMCFLYQPKLPEKVKELRKF